MQKQPKIDETDAKILHSLLKESRTTFTEIAKECKITVNAVKSRFERLKRDGVITGNIMQINPQRLGYNFVADVGIATAPEDEKKVIESLKRKPYIIFGGPGFSWKHNISIFVAAPSVEKLASIRDDLEANPLIKNVDAQIWVETINIDHPETLMLNSFKTSQKPQAISKKSSEGSVPTAEIDKIDKQIAKILAENARTPFSEIAKRLNISTKNVIQRYQRLRGDLLTLSAITVDLKKLGYNCVESIQIKVSNKSEIPKLCTQLLQIPNVIVVIKIIGYYDLRIIVALADFEEMFRLAQQIRGIQGIEEVEAFPCYPFPKWPLNVFAPLLEP